jgi:VWFA-related protein
MWYADFTEPYDNLSDARGYRIMKRFNLSLLAVLCIAAPILAHGQNPENDTSAPTLRVTSRAVLLDVLVTDHDGTPVTGLKQEAFHVIEQGKPQTISFFEEHKAVNAEPVELPSLPDNVFTNFSPIERPPVVNVLLLDSLNTPLEDQAYVHKQAMKFLKSLRPGSRMAIFTMSMGLRFVQGFTDDPAILVAALGSKKSNEVEVPALIKSQEESVAQSTVVGEMTEVMPAGPGGTTTAATQAMIDALTSFFQRTETSQTDDRAYRTLANLQQLAAFLAGFPGRKNLIWFSESFPLTFSGVATAQFAGTDTRTETRFEGDLHKVIDLLTAARVAIYPVDARGTKAPAIYEASTALGPTVSTGSQITGVNGAQATALLNEGSQRDSDQETMKIMARESGGKAFVNTNGLSEVISKVVSSSSDFYSVSYTPDNGKMDGSYRPVEVKVAGGKYTLSYRRGYFADDSDLPGAAADRSGKGAANVVGDPLRPFMEFGMPQTEQILYKALIQLLPPAQSAAATDAAKVAKGPQKRYSVDFAIDLKDVDLKLNADGLHTGTLNLSLIVYDRYGNAVSHRDHLVALNIKPDVYKVFEQTGVQLHAEVEVPEGQYWLRTGVYDAISHKAGTLEVPLSAVKAPETAAR